MPGIAGIIRKRPYPEIRSDLHTMVNGMRHDRFYFCGEYINEELGLYAGWSCHRGSFADCMPLIGRDKDVVLIFQGETYPDTDESSARYLLELYYDLGKDFLSRLNGWYCGLIADLGRKSITLFNDRYGMGRVYLHDGNDEFLFASEAKSLLKIRPARRAIDPRAVAEYLRYGCVPGNRSLFNGISLLPPASAWEFEGEVVRRGAYFQFSKWEQQKVLGAEEFYPKFAETVSTIFPTYAKSPRKVALSLTAGLDTRAVLASLSDRNGSLPCYTFGGPWGELYDIRTARKLAGECHETFSVIRADGEYLKQFPEIAREAVYISDGTHDAFGAHDLYLNRIARVIAPIRLTGKFGSEVVRTRKLMAWESYTPGFLQPDLASLLDKVPSVSKVYQSPHPLTRVVCEGIPWYELGRVAVEQSQVTLRTPYMDNRLVKLMFQAPAQTRAAGDVQERYVREKTPRLSQLPTNLGRFVSNNPTITKLLYLWYRALFKVEYIYLFATPHWLTRLDRKVERLRPERIVTGRQKWEGYRLWIKTDFADFIRDTLLNPGARYTEFFQRKTVEQMVKCHTAGTHNYLKEINRALTIELICLSLLQ